MVLVVDDEAAILFVACRALQSYGYRTLKAEDGAEAIALFAKHANEIDVVVTDVMMPVMDGHALVRALRQLSPRVKIIAASGLESVGSGTNLTIEGANKFLPKPYTAKALLSALEDVLHKS
jgi:CheY-like chemotaxis protein